MAGLLVLLLSSAVASIALPHHDHEARGTSVKLDVPTSLAGASIEHSPSFSSFSIETAFFVEFVGTASEPNELFFKLLSHITERGGRPILRPGGITMDSLIFDPAGGDLERTMGPNGEVYRSTVGPAYFESWATLPEEVSFISTLNFGNNSLQIAADLATASVKYQAGRIQFLELGNEPNNYPNDRWKNSTQAYVDQWKNWTASIDQAVAEVSVVSRGSQETLRWWASSATTDNTPLKVRPVDLIEKGIDSEQQVGQFSIHSYVYNTCNPSDAAKATVENLLNHTQIISFAEEEVAPSARAAAGDGKPWVMGEFNSIACSGKPGVSDTFTQALWMIDTQLAYAVLNATAVFQHQGATLVLQSDKQTNTPGFSTYSFVYPRDSDKHGEARANPSYAGLLFLTEVFSQPKTRILPLEAPAGLDPDRFSGYVMYQGDEPTKLVLLNLEPYYLNSTTDFSINVDISSYIEETKLSSPRVNMKRLTAPSIDETDSNKVTWAGQSFKNGDSTGYVEIEQLSTDNIVKVRGSEGVIVFLREDSVYRL
ncbi:hypothetical protein SLS62_004680 [Diatrype stigma]|uniref:Beta-glucuronidase C-terminal domain-containing protein n=1 Tax=Diatrype stigma TaxID=117547 RepID=A0AAN9UQY7_9PEZI